MKTIAIIATRDYAEEKILAYLMEMEADDDMRLLTGGHNAGQAAIVASIRRNWRNEQYLPDYKNHGKNALHIRSWEMIQQADEVLCFWNGQSKGTASEIKMAQRAGKHITYLDQHPQEPKTNQLRLLY